MMKRNAVTGPFLISMALMVVSSAVVAQVQPPVREYVDENGVDLLTGTMTSVYRGASIGSASAGLRFTRYFRGTGSWDSYLGVITSAASTYSVTLDVATEEFAESGGTFTSVEGNGATLTLSGGTYTYTTRSGIIATYDARPADYAYPAANRASLSTVTYPNGERLTAEYQSQTICIVWLGAQEGCGSSATSVRLKSVTSNYGYKLSIVYAQDSYTVAADALLFHLPAQITVSNLADGSTAGSVGIVVSFNTNTYTVELTDALGRITKYTVFNGKGIWAIRRPGSTVDDVTVSYWGDNKVSSVDSGGVHTTYAYADAGTNPVIRTATVTRPAGAQRVLTFNLTTQRLLTDRNELNRTTTYEYNAQGRLFRVIAPEGNFVQYTYDARGNVTQTLLGAKSGGATIATSANFDVTCVNRKTCNQPNFTIDAKGNRTDFEYFPEHGGVQTVTLPAPKSGAVRPQTRFSYTALQAWYQDSSGSMVPSGQPIHLLTGVWTCRNSSTCVGTNDEIKTTIDHGPTGVGNNLLTRTVTSSNGTGTLVSVTAYAYDSVGNLLTVDGPISGTSDTTRTRYDALRRIVGVVSPDPDGGGPRTPVAARNTYSTAGDLETVQKGTVNSQSDADWANFQPFETVSFVHDDAGPTRKSLSSGGTTYAVEQVTRNASGRPECIAQRMNPAAFAALSGSACDLGTEGAFGPDRIARFAYDAAGHVTTVTTGYGTTNAIDVITTYTPNGRIETVKDGKGNLTKYEYDGFDRLFKTFYPDPDTPGTHSPTIFEQRGYDANSNLTSLRARNEDVIGFVPDALNRIELKNLPSGEDVYFSYDNHGRLLTASYGSPTGPGIVNTYDGLGRLDTRTSFGRTLDHDHDVAGRRTRVTHPDGFYAAYVFNAAGELTSITDSTGTTLASFTYDALGRRDTIERANGTIADYGYDAVSRLNALTQNLASTNYDGTSNFTHSPAHQITSHTQTNDAAYTWAPSGNGTTGMSHNGLNQLTQIGSTTVGHDELGNLETGASTFAYGYDIENQLRSADSTDTTVSLGYDPLGLLNEVTVNGASTKFLYDGADLVAEYSDSGTLLRRYVHGVGMDEPLVWYEGSGTTDRRYFHADERGSIVAISNNSGAGTVRFNYSPDGEATNAASSRFGYTGQVSLAQIGLCYYKSRMYSPKLGRFLQTDAIGYAGGMNLYAYAGGDPINHIDPFGFTSVSDYNMPDWIWWWGQSREADQDYFADAYYNHPDGQSASDGEPQEPQGEQREDNCNRDVDFDFDQFANQVEQNRFDLEATLATLIAAEAVGTMPKTPGELRGLGVPRTELNPYTSQLSRWSSRLGSRALRELGRTRGAMIAGTAATLGVVFEGFYDWGTIGKAAWDATSFSECPP